MDGNTESRLLSFAGEMIRAVLPNPSAQAEWLLAGIIDTALGHWARAHPLDGGDDDDDADTGTDVCSGVITDSLAFERAIYSRCASVQPLPSALQLATRQRGARFLSDLGQ